MSPDWVSPPPVTPPTVRRLSGDDTEPAVPVQRLDVAPVPEASVVPRQLDPASLRMASLQRENEHLRAELEALRSP